MTEPEHCAECGFDSTRLSVHDAIAALRSMGRRWRDLFEDQPDEAIRRRPALGVWSPIEYAAHTSDVLSLLGFGLNDVLEAKQPPTYPAVDPSDAGPDRSAELDPADVLDSLARNATAIADRADRAPSGAMQRTATIGDTSRTAEWLLKHALHDASHHLRDVTRQLPEV